MISKLSLPFIFLILTNLVASGTAIHFCFNNGNTTGNSVYKSNLDALFSSLSKSVDDNGFYNASMGQNPNTAYANVLCRGDVQLSTCRSCIQNATIEIVNSCPNYKQAVVWDEFCMLRYSNESMYGISTADPPVFAWSMQNVSSPDQFMADVKTLIEDLRGQAVLGGSLRKVAAGNKTSSNFQTVFSLVQCTPDLSSEDCDSCLIKAAGYIPSFCDGKRGCRSLQPSCNIRYEDVPFYNETRLHELQAYITPQPQPSPPPSLPLAPPLSPPPPPAAISSSSISKAMPCLSSTTRAILLFFWMIMLNIPSL